MSEISQKVGLPESEVYISAWRVTLSLDTNTRDIHAEVIEDTKDDSPWENADKQLSMNL